MSLSHKSIIFFNFLLIKAIFFFSLFCSSTHGMTQRIIVAIIVKFFFIFFFWNYSKVHGTKLFELWILYISSRKRYTKTLAKMSPWMKWWSRVKTWKANQKWERAQGSHGTCKSVDSQQHKKASHFIFAVCNWGEILL